jgi:ankyrin repeat protein
LLSFSYYSSFPAQFRSFDVLLKSGAIADVVNDFCQSPLHTIALAPLTTSLLCQFLQSFLTHVNSSQLPTILQATDNQQHNFFHLLFARTFPPSDPPDLTLCALLVRLFDLIPDALTCPTPQNKQLIHLSAEVGNDLFLRLLCCYSPPINFDVADGLNRTPLHYAILSQNLASIKILQQMNVNCHLKDSNGHTPIDLTSDTETIYLLQSPPTSIPDMVDVFVCDPPLFARCHTSFIAENEIELSLDSGSIVMVLIHFPTSGWVFVETLDKRKGIIPFVSVYIQLPLQESASNTIRYAIDYLVKEKSSLFYSLDLQGDISLHLPN